MVWFRELKDTGEAQAQVVLRRDSLSGWKGDGCQRQERRPTFSLSARQIRSRDQKKASMAAAEADGGRSQIASLVQDLLAPGELASQQEQSESGL